MTIAAVPFTHKICENRTAFIAFTGSHQLLLFPMFEIQRKLQRNVFGVRFWEKVERQSKEESSDQSRNEFNPRHIQILLRTYQTGDAAAILRHTGDPKLGLHDECKNNGQEDEDSSMQRWNSLRESISTKAKLSQRWGRVKEHFLKGDLWRIEKVKSKIFPFMKEKVQVS